MFFPQDVPTSTHGDNPPTDESSNMASTAVTSDEIATTTTNGTITPHSDSTAYPKKTREIQNHHQDSRIWNTLPLRPSDIIITTYSKSGTTWVQQIVSQLLHSGDPSISPALLSPWVDLRLVPAEAMTSMLEAQTHRRFMKTHLPIDALNYSEVPKYIFIGRDARDMIWSVHNHMYNATPFFYSLINDTPGRVGPELIKPAADPRELFLDLVEDDSSPSLPWPMWSFIRGYWEARALPNLLLVHFNNLKADMEGEIKRIAKFLNVEVEEEKWGDVLEHCGFQWMKEHSELVSPPQAADAWEGGSKTFINKGTNGRWRDVLTDEDNKRLEKKAREELGEECARWLETGQM